MNDPMRRCAGCGVVARAVLVGVLVEPGCPPVAYLLCGDCEAALCAGGRRKRRVFRRVEARIRSAGQAQRVERHPRRRQMRRGRRICPEPRVLADRHVARLAGAYRHGIRAARVQLRANRKLGTMLGDAEDAKGGRPETAAKNPGKTGGEPFPMERVWT